MIGETCETVGRRKQLQLLVLLEQSLVDAIQLESALAQPIDHVIEHLGEMADFATTSRGWQIDGEVASCNFASRLCQPIEWPRNQPSETVSGYRHCNQEERNYEEGDVAEAAKVEERGLSGCFGDDAPTYLRNVLERADHLTAAEALIGERRPHALA